MVRESASSQPEKIEWKTLEVEIVEENRDTIESDAGWAVIPREDEDCY